MTPEQQAAYVVAQATCAVGELIVVQTAAISLGHAVPLQKVEEIMVKYGIKHNQVISFFHHY